ncbi:MAG TPA: hypothetical protein VIQ51_03445, partial [Chryseosolibacter sp.]
MVNHLHCTAWQSIGCPAWLTLVRIRLLLRICFMVQSPIVLRKELHRNPELSGEEFQTASTIKTYLEHHGARVISGIGGHGVAGV